MGLLTQMDIVFWLPQAQGLINSKGFSTRVKQGHWRSLLASGENINLCKEVGDLELVQIVFLYCNLNGKILHELQIDGFASLVVKHLCVDSRKVCLDNQINQSDLLRVIPLSKATYLYPCHKRVVAKHLRHPLNHALSGSFYHLRNKLSWIKRWTVWCQWQ
jgi:hypothetical protein